ncbi:hypothetical protein [Chitinophaga sp. YIM B06452]|uniref:hypothetical protein n=1 Tax=Chitinophaga sp. YIM B06452 TaxID=3082158 RepID=UPI0031FED2BD
MIKTNSYLLPLLLCVTTAFAQEKQISPPSPKQPPSREDTLMASRHVFHKKAASQQRHQKAASLPDREFRHSPADHLGWKQGASPQAANRVLQRQDSSRLPEPRLLPKDHRVGPSRSSF